MTRMRQKQTVTCSNELNCLNISVICRGMRFSVFIRIVPSSWRLPALSLVSDKESKRSEIPVVPQFQELLSSKSFSHVSAQSATLGSNSYVGAKFSDLFL